MGIRRTLWLLAVTFLAACAGPSLTLQVDEQAVRVFAHGEAFAGVHYRAEPRPFIWPLYAPGQIPVTRDFPMDGANSNARVGEQQDHAHHQSLWFAHGDVDGFDFWHGTSHRERIVLDSIYAQVGITDYALVQCEYIWRVEDDRDLLRETRQICFHDEGDVRMVDVLVVLRAVGDEVTFGDTKEGTFAMRLHPALRVEGEVATGTLQASEGASGRAAWGQRARWINDAGTVDGASVGVAIFDHPDNLRSPTTWHARTYGLVAANPFGVHDFEGEPEGAGDFVLRSGETLKLRYRVLLHGGLDRDAIEARYQQWLLRDE